MNKTRLELGDSQKVSLELGVKVDEICRKHNIKYTLICDTLLGAHQYKGFTPWNHTMEFAMLYEEYLKFLDVCCEELEDSTYYIVNQSTHTDFKENITLFAKKSRVTLPKHREHDRIYYDFTVKVIPIFNAGETLEVCHAHRKYCKHLQEIMFVTKPVKQLTTIHNFKKRIKHYYEYKKYNRIRNEAEVKLNNMYLQYKESTPFVFLNTDGGIHKGIVIKRETYLELEEIEFEGYSFLGIKNGDKWIADYYEDRLEENKGDEINKVSIMGPEVLRRLQLVELEMLVEIDRICRKHDIKYALFAGTLLGAIRHKGFIPWDDDVDLCMLKEEYDKFLKVAPLELDPEKYFIRTQETDKDCNLSFAQLKRNNTLYYRKNRGQFCTHLGVFVDILPLYNGTDNWILHKFQLYVCRFLKTMLWSHMGAVNETRPGYKMYYNLLAKVPNKVSYKWYDKIANMFEKEKSGKISYLSVYRNPFNEVFSFRKTYEDLVETEFEGHKFYIPRKYDEVLNYLYSDEYMNLPRAEDRFAKHTAAVVDLGDLHELK